MKKIEKYFGCHVFNTETMKSTLPNDVFVKLQKAAERQEPIDASIADEVAKALKQWAMDLGATHYTHWFQPMTGITAEKHESFLSPNGNSGVIAEFSGKELIKGEPDASSFPSGGLRATFEARGYTMWDPTSFAFVKDKTLYIPTLFLSFDGACLDKKTPLLRSMNTLSQQATRLLHLIGDKDVQYVTTTVGPEQEYFLIDKDVFEKRLDLVVCGRTLIGAEPVKGQELADHYFANLPTRVKKFMEDLDKTLWALGIYAKTEHKEVAPRQFELAPVFTTSNIACDHNQITMDVLKTVAHRHGFECLLQEKPFDFINGSGKHNNWSLVTDTNINLLGPGKKPEENLRFLLFLSAVIKAVDEYQDLLRISVASAGNDHRLGGHEAPPAIISIYLGAELEGILEAIEKGVPYVRDFNTQLNVGVSSLSSMSKDTTDRNRTSPFAFTGNKFEFRMLGSAVSISCPNTILNTIVSESLKSFADELEMVTGDMDEAIKKLIAKTVKEHKRIIFNGNGYTDEWVAEAKARGLLNLPTTADALVHYTDQKNIDLFEKHQVYSAIELQARENILLDNYFQNIHIEAKTLAYMLDKQILPAVEKYESSVLKNLKSKIEILGSVSTAETGRLKAIDELYLALTEESTKLHDIVAKTFDDAKESAFFAKEVILPEMAKAREIADTLETKVPKDFWPIPDYNDILLKPLD